MASKILLEADLSKLGSKLASHLYISDVLATPEGLKDEVGKAQHLQHPKAAHPLATNDHSLQCLGMLSVCGTCC